MDGPHIQIAVTGAVMPLRPDVTTIGRGKHVDVRLADPSVSVLHAEIVLRGPYAYVNDLGLSHNGTRVNGRLVGRRVLHDGDVLTFGAARCRVSGLAAEDLDAEVELGRSEAPELTRREVDVVISLCRPALSDDAFVTPATAREIAADLVVTEAAVKQHLLRLYSKLRIPEGQNRRIRLANEVVALGLVHPMPTGGQRTPGQGPSGHAEGYGQLRPGPGAQAAESRGYAEGQGHSAQRAERQARAAGRAAEQGRAPEQAGERGRAPEQAGERGRAAEQAGSAGADRRHAAGQLNGPGAKPAGTAEPLLVPRQAVTGRLTGRYGWRS